MRINPNIENAKNKAYEALSRHKISDFPVNMIEILSSYKDIKVITYTEMARKHKCSIEDIIKVNSSEDGVIHYSGKRNKYLIIYNDTVASKERIYWTLAHEFGHYLLDHHKETDKTSLTRGTVSIEELDTFEVEANFFSRHFITPPPIIVNGDIDNHHKIMGFFGVSFSVATLTLKYIKESYRKGFRFSLPNNIANSFMLFINKLKYGKTCYSCNTFSYNGNPTYYCSICGSSDFHNFTRGVDAELLYNDYVLDQEMRVVVCPKCSNEEVSGNYCKICGIYLFNVCTGIDLNEYPNFEHENTRWDRLNEGCEEPLEGNARFCSSCGSTSSFFEERVLKPWGEVNNNNVPVSTLGDDLPF